MILIELGFLHHFAEGQGWGDSDGFEDWNYAAHYTYGQGGD